MTTPEDLAALEPPEPLDRCSACHCRTSSFPMALEMYVALRGLMGREELGRALKNAHVAAGRFWSWMNGGEA